MKKAYSAPRFYCESFEMHPIIGTDCANGVFDLEHFQQLQAGTITKDQLIANDKSEDVQLNLADSWVCYGASYEVGMIGGNGWYMTFHSAPGKVSICTGLNTIDDLPYPISMYANYCYHVPTFVLLNFASF